MTPGLWFRAVSSLDARRGGGRMCAGVSAHRTRVPWGLAAALALVPWADAATGAGGLSAQVTAGVNVLPNDRDALEALYHATGGPDWDRSDRWLTDRPIGLWYGVFTNSTGRVERLELRDNDLRGPIPPEIGNLTALTFLELSGNDLDGSIPSEIGNLAALEWLDLGDNDLSGAIPAEIGNLAMLRILVLEDNELSGSIPPEIGKLVALTTLNLAYSGLGGPIPSEIGKLASLRYLDLIGSGWSGAIPPEMANLAGLQSLKFNSLGYVGPGDQGWLVPDLCVRDSRRLLAWLAALHWNPPRCSGGGTGGPNGEDIGIAFADSSGFGDRSTDFYPYTFDIEAEGLTVLAAFARGTELGFEFCQYRSREAVPAMVGWRPLHWLGCDEDWPEPRTFERLGATDGKGGEHRGGVGGTISKDGRTYEMRCEDVSEAGKGRRFACWLREPWPRGSR